MLDKPLDIQDIKKRYADAMKEVIEHHKEKEIEDLAKKIGKSVDEAGNIVAELTENRMPKIYHFTLKFKRISLKKFMKIQEELFENLMIPDYGHDYNIIFTTNSDTYGVGYGCHIETRPDLIQ
tara:strand:- start:2254 stop:2622 length:369 start_codon:yes stop_codon:yes gene_type:complete